MSTRTVSLRTALGMMAGTLAVFFAGVYAAHAKAGGETANTLSFAGTLTNAPIASPTLTFTFKKGGATVCTPAGIDVVVTPEPVTGHFQAAIPLGTCPGSLFDGGDVTIDVAVEGTPVASGQAVNPVPYAKYADKVGSPDCPVGYTNAGLAASFLAESILCQKGKDEIVKVGVGASAFWIDRYEASLWTTDYGPDAPPPGKPAGVQKFVGGFEDVIVGFPKNGQATSSLFALSVTGVDPGRSVTWFQAMEACAASGKRLPTGSEWLRAARRTNDPGANDGFVNNKCQTMAGVARKTGNGTGATEDTSCVSYWGAQDMIGNVWEWTDEWHAGLGDAGLGVSGISHWPGASYGDDATWNIASSASDGVAPVPNIPAAAVRGGGWGDNVLAGVFALALDSAPSTTLTITGFRCVIPR